MCGGGGGGRGGTWPFAIELCSESTESPLREVPLCLLGC